MDNEYIQALRKEVKKEFTADKARYWHTIGVAETSACLAMRYGVDMQKAFTAGLLHDCAKCYSDEQLIKICESNNIEITQAERLSPYLLHAKAGAFLPVQNMASMMKIYAMQSDITAQVIPA